MKVFKRWYGKGTMISNSVEANLNLATNFEQFKFYYKMALNAILKYDAHISNLKLKVE